VLYYKRKNGKNIKDNGCTVDLFTKHSNMIKFKAGVKNKTADCLKDCSSLSNIFDGASANLLVFYSIRNFPILFSIPFAYSLKGNNITEVKNSARFGKVKECAEMCNKGHCMEWTSLEVGWNRCFYKGRRQVTAHTHPSKTNLFNFFYHLYFSW